MHTPNDNIKSWMQDNTTAEHGAIDGNNMIRIPNVSFVLHWVSMILKNNI